MKEDRSPGLQGGGVGSVVDPTKNVLDLVAAESKFQNAMREAETRRVNELAAQRQMYEARLAELLAAQVQDRSDLVSTQLAGIQVGMNSRLALLEQFRWESGGKSSGQSAMVAGFIAMASVVIAGIVAAVTLFRPG